VLPFSVTTRRVLFTLTIAVLAGGCVDLETLAGGEDDFSAKCPIGQQELDGRCVEAPAPQPATPDGACAEGLQDNDKDALCEASCASAKLGCAPHSKCVDASGKASCVCALGYEHEGEACVWRGGPRDPGFQNKPTSWEVGGGAIDPAAMSPIDPGRVRFTGAGVCSGAGFVRQAFPMPAFADAEPFALEIQGQQTLEYDEIGGISFLLGGALGGQGELADTGKLHACLGDRAYGRDVDLRIRATSVACGPTSLLDLDRVAIVPDATCPAPGRVINGDFEATGGWAVSGTGAEVATGVGTAGGRGGHLSTTNLCQSPSLLGSWSPPSTGLARPALSFTYKGNVDGKMTVTAGPSATLGEVVGTATFQAARLCVPEWAKGVVHPLRFNLVDPGGLCADPNARDFVFDDLAFVSEPSCPEASYVADGSFESSTATVLPWVLEHSTQYSTSARIVRNAAASAHGGSQYLSLSSGQVCHYGRATQTITVPPASGAAGPAVKLWYRLPAATKAVFTMTPGGLFATSASWVQKIVCLDSKDAGRPVQLRINASGGSGTCATTFSTEDIDVDDIEVTTDASCPAK
jgi:hypothetical protein